MQTQKRNERSIHHHPSSPFFTSRLIFLHTEPWMSQFLFILRLLLFSPKWNEKKEKSVNTRQERQQWNNNEKGKTRFSFFFLRFTLSRDENKKHKGKHTGGGFESQQAVVKNAEGKRLPFALFIIHEDLSSSAIKTTKREGKRGRGKPFTMKLQLVDWAPRRFLISVYILISMFLFCVCLLMLQSRVHSACRSFVTKEEMASLFVPSTTGMEKGRESLS